MKKSTNNPEQPISILLFGAVLGTVASTMLHTTKGKQLMHDAKSVVDDFVSLLEHALDDDVSFEESISGVQVFSDHVMDKLERVDAFNTAQKVSQPVQPVVVRQPQVRVAAPQVRQVPAASVPRPHHPTSQTSVPDSRVSAFMYHKPVERVAPTPKKAVDDEIALLHQLGKQMFR